jgi:hypothetical protein
MSGQHVTKFLKAFGNKYVTTTYIRKLLETDVAISGNEEDRKWL